MLWTVCLAVTLLSYSEVIAPTDAQKNAEIGVGSHISEVADPAVRLALGASSLRMAAMEASIAELRAELAARDSTPQTDTTKMGKKLERLSPTHARGRDGDMRARGR